MDIQDLAILPAVEHPLGQGYHLPVIGKKLLTCEGGGGQTALPLPGFTFIAQKAFPEERRYMAPNDAVLDVVLVILDEDLLDRVHIVDEQGRPSRDIQRNEVAISTRRFQ